MEEGRVLFERGLGPWELGLPKAMVAALESCDTANGRPRAKWLPPKIERGMANPKKQRGPNQRRNPILGLKSWRKSLESVSAG